MRSIPKKLKEEMADDPWYSRCALFWDGGCADKIDWHHALIHGGRQVNEKFCIIPLCRYHHNKIEGDKKLKKKVDAIMRQRASEEQIKKYNL